MKHLDDYFNPMPHAAQVVYYLLQLLKVPVTKTNLRNELAEHPDFSSLLSISDILKGYGVDNIAVRLNTQRFTELPLPFLAHMKNSRSRRDFFVIVNKVENGRINLYDPETQKKSWISTEEFEKHYNGTVLAVEAVENAKEKDYEKNAIDERKKNRVTLLFVLLVPLVSLSVLLNGRVT